MFAPSVRKEYLKRLQQANAASQQAYHVYMEAKKANAAALSEYYAARTPYEKAMAAFPTDRYYKVQEGKIPPAPGDEAKIAQIAAFQKEAMRIADKFAVEVDHVQRLFNGFQGCITREKAAYATLQKYMEDKKAIKEKEDPTAYKKWKKELRAELFK
jgi:hypothetical protein